MKSLGFLILPVVVLLTTASCSDVEPCTGPFESSIRGDDAIILALRQQEGIALDACWAMRFQYLVDAGRTAAPDLLADIHAWPGFVLHDVLLQATGTVRAALDGGSLQTGIAKLDDLLAVYQLRSVRAISPRPEETLYLLKFAEPVHAPRLAQAITDLHIPEIPLVSPNGYIGDGDDIVTRRTSDGWRLTFDRAGGDCPSGCTTHIETTVLVRDDGRVDLLGTKRDLE